MNPVMPAKPAKPAGAGKAVRIWRTVLGLAGVALLGYGLLGLPTQLGPPQLLGLLVWLAVAVLLHDGVIVPVSTVAGAGLTRWGSGAASGVGRGSARRPDGRGRGDRDRGDFVEGPVSGP